MKRGITVWEECEHGWMRPHALLDGQGYAERNVVGRCPGGRSVSLTREEALKALAQGIAYDFGWDYPDDFEIASEHADSALNALLVVVDKETP